MDRLVRLNDWRFRSLLFLIAALQLLVLVLTGLPATLPLVSPLRMLVGVIYLTFIPGFLMLRILRVHHFSGVKTVVYSLALSISLVTFTGLLASTVLPVFGVVRPVSSLPMTLSVSFMVILLGVFAYFRDGDFQPEASDALPLLSLVSPHHWLLVMLPLLGAVAALLSARLQNNILSFALIALIAVIVGLIAFDRLISPQSYALAIFVINYTTFLYHGILATPYPLGFNLDDEYYSQTLLLQQGYWNPSGHAMFSSLGSSLLGPTYALITGIDMAFVRSGVFPFLFSFLVLVVFSTCREHMMKPKTAFFASFFMVAVVSLWQINLHATRYLVGTLLFGALVVLVVDRQLLALQKASLALMLALSLAMSYYGTANIGAILFFLAWVVRIVMRSRIGRKHWQDSQDLAASSSLLHFTWVALCIILALSWQMFTSPGFHFSQPFYVLQRAYEGLSDFFSLEVRPPDVAMGLGMGLGEVPELVRVSRFLHYFAQVLIVIGMLRSLFYPGRLSLRTDYIALAFSSIVFLALATLVPHLAFSWGTARIYFFSLIVLAPMGIIGAETVGYASRRAVRWLRRGRSRGAIGTSQRQPVSDEPLTAYFRFIAIFVLVPIMLLQSGFVYEMLYRLAPEYAQRQRLVRFWHLVPDKMDQFAYNRGEVTAVEWLAAVRGYRMRVAVDKFGMMLATFWFGNVGGDVTEILPDEEIPPRTYIYFRGWNIRQEEVRVDATRTAFVRYALIKDLPLLSDAVNSADIIYDNGEARTFLRR